MYPIPMVNMRTEVERTKINILVFKHILYFMALVKRFIIQNYNKYSSDQLVIQGFLSSLQLVLVPMGLFCVLHYNQESEPCNLLFLIYFLLPGQSRNQ